MSHVLITGINYWPEQTGIGPYTAQVAEHMVVLGHGVTVITGLPHYPQWKVPGEYAHGSQDQFRAGVRLIRRQHYVPKSQSVLRRAAYEATFFSSGLFASLSERPDLVMGVTPSLSGAALARWFGRRFRVPYGVIVQDLVGLAVGQSGMNGGAAASALARGLERVTVGAADAVAVVSEGFVPYLRDLGVPGDRVMHLPNWSRLTPSRGDRAAARRRLGWDEDTQVVLHGGNMGLKQGLEQMVDAARVAASEGLTIRFVLMGDGSQRAFLEERARGLANFSFVPIQPDDVFADLLSAADVLMLSERSSVLEMSLPSKLTSYFAAGRPVLAAVNPSGATAREIDRSGAGLVVQAGDPDAVIKGLRLLKSNAALCNELARAGVAYASDSLAASDAHRRIETFLEMIRAAVSRSSRGRARSRPVWH